MAFLEVLTRVYRRPGMLRTNIESLEAQSDGDWIQTMLIDGEGRGVGPAQAALADYAPYLRGEFIWILDDDDQCTEADLVALCKGIVAEENPDLIMVKMDHGSRGVLPEAGYWQRPPAISHIGCSAYIVRRALWQRHAGALRSAHYSSDFDFISAIFGEDPEIFWLDRIVSKVQRISMGRREIDR